jgi:hypothetical protein
MFALLDSTCGIREALVGASGSHPRALDPNEMNHLDRRFALPEFLSNSAPLVKTQSFACVPTEICRSSE